MRYIFLLLTAFTLGCSHQKAGSPTAAVSSGPETSADELLDPHGAWNKTYEGKHPHLSAMPLQFAQWKKIDPLIHTWCVGFEAKECEETYSNDLYQKQIATKVDPKCWEALRQTIYHREDYYACDGNFITYYELEYIDPIWKPGRPKTAHWTADGYWDCPAGFSQHTYSAQTWPSNEPSVYYVPPKNDCTRYFLWGIWKPSPYRTDRVAQ